MSMQIEALPTTLAEGPTRASAIFWVALALALCGWVDYATGYEVSVFALYALPIALSVRSMGTASGCWVAVLCAGVWIAADLGAGHRYAHPWVMYWNALHRLFFFMCVVLVIHHTRASLKANARRLQAFSGPLPICTQCDRIGSPNGYWQKFESYLVEQGGAQPVHKVCPDCARQSYAKAGVIEHVSHH